MEILIMVLTFAHADDSVETVNFPNPVQTELTEIPVIIVKDEVQLYSPEFSKLSPQVLSDLAYSMSGVVGYLKVRAYYLPVEGEHCTAHDCWRPAVDNTIRCDSHSLED